MNISELNPGHQVELRMNKSDNAPGRRSFSGVFHAPIASIHENYVLVEGYGDPRFDLSTGMAEDGSVYIVAGG